MAVQHRCVSTKSSGPRSIGKALHYSSADLERKRERSFCIKTTFFQMRFSSATASAAAADDFTMMQYHLKDKNMQIPQLSGAESIIHNPPAAHRQSKSQFQFR